MNLSILDLIEKSVPLDVIRSESLKLDFALGLLSILNKNKISYSQLAKNVGASQAYISKVLRGDTNVTIETMVKLASGANGEVHLRVAGTGKNFCWAGKNNGRRASISAVRPSSSPAYAFTARQQRAGGVAQPLTVVGAA